MGQTDAAYRRLFQHRELLRDLLACVLDVKLFEKLDWERMEPLPTSLVSDRLRSAPLWPSPRKSP
ncbi:Transposase OS=Castellaniella defragrans OX=75697 GN=HNR28_000705 PE=4 SV=1 [Castellaniella defragrans]